MSGPHRSADPVRALLHRHRQLCERAVDPLEIAAALEAHGITDRTAARFRHRDVFSLAEELYARTPRADETLAARSAPADAPAAPRRPAGTRRRGAGRVRTVLLPLLPGGLCAAALGAPALAGGLPPSARPAVAVAGAVLVLVSVWICLRGIAPTGTAVSWTTVPAGCWLVGYALVGDRLLAGALGDGMRVAGPAERCVPLGLAAAVGPAVWCARWFAVRARRRLRASRSLEEFAAGTRPLLGAAVAVFAAALLAALTAAHVAADGGTVGDLFGGPLGGPAGPEAAPVAAAAALGTLLFAAALLTAHGFPAAAAAGLAAACALEAAALAAALAARRPALEPLARPVRAVAETWGPAAVPAVACACAALALLAFAAGALTGASAHHRVGP